MKKCRNLTFSSTKIILKERPLATNVGSDTLNTIKGTVVVKKPELSIEKMKSGSIFILIPTLN